MLVRGGERFFLSSLETWTPKRIAGISLALGSSVSWCVVNTWYPPIINSHLFVYRSKFHGEVNKISGKQFDFWILRWFALFSQKADVHRGVPWAWMFATWTMKVKHQQLGCEKFQEEWWIWVDRRIFLSVHVNNGILTPASQWRINSLNEIYFSQLNLLQFGRKNESFVRMNSDLL